MDGMQYVVCRWVSTLDGCISGSWHQIYIQKNLHWTYSFSIKLRQSSSSEWRDDAKKRLFQSAKRHSSETSTPFLNCFCAIRWDFMRQVSNLKIVGIPSQYIDCVLLDYCVFALHQMDNNPLHQRGSTIPHTNQPRSDYGQWQLAKKIWRTQLWMILTYNDRSPLSIHLYLAWAGLELPANMRDKDVLLVSDREKFSQLPAISSPHFFTCENCCLPNNTSSCFGRKSPQFVLRGTRSAANPLHYRPQMQHSWQLFSSLVPRN